MGKIILISGANDSGKSAFAEQLACAAKGPRYYIATMVPHTEENLRRIEKHRRQRSGMGFTTLELPSHVDEAAVAEDGVVLLEDVSNLMANAMFDEGRGAAAVTEEILALAERCCVLIVVTISSLHADAYEGETLRYIAALQEVNRGLYDKAAAAAKLDGGEVCWQKGGAADAF